MMTEMVKGNMTSMVPMMVVGGWINWHFSGFVTTKVASNFSVKASLYKTLHICSPRGVLSSLFGGKFIKSVGEEYQVVTRGIE